MRHMLLIQFLAHVGGLRLRRLRGILCSIFLHTTFPNGIQRSIALCNPYSISQLRQIFQ